MRYFFIILNPLFSNNILRNNKTDIILIKTVIKQEIALNQSFISVKYDTLLSIR